jgi:amidase
VTIGVLRNHLWGGEIDPEVRTAVDRAARLCEELGATVVEASLSFDDQAFIAATVDVWCALIAASVQDAAAEGDGLEAALGKLEGHTRSWAEYGLGLDVRNLLAGAQVLTDISREVAEQTASFDALLSSTLPTLPIPLGEYDPNRAVSVDWYYSSAVGNLESTTNLFNATGQPAISLPLYESSSGLPIGIHLAGRFGDEATLIRLSAALEAAAPWRDRLPRVHVSR